MTPMPATLFRSLTALALAFTFSACAPATVCERLDQATRQLDEKNAPCFGAEENPGLSASELAACERDLDACQPSDVTKIEAYADCLGAMPACVKGQEGEYVAHLESCSRRLEGVSSACFIAD